MKALTIIIGLFLLTMIAQSSYAQQSPPSRGLKATTNPTPEQQKIINLSKKEWRWMAEKNVDSLRALYDDEAMFVHMGGTWGADQELAIIKSGSIWYKKAVVYATKVTMFGNTAILLSDIDLVAMVGGHKVTSAFMVTEVYIKENDKWKLGQLTFSHLIRPVKINNNNQ